MSTTGKRFGLGLLGGLIGLVGGLAVAILWTAYNGNLMMPEPVYEKQRTAALLGVCLPSAFGAIAGVVFGALPRARPLIFVLLAIALVSVVSLLAAGLGKTSDAR